MNRKNLSRTTFFTALGLTVLGLALTVPGVMLAQTSGESEGFGPPSRGPHMRGPGPHAGGPKARIEQMMQHLDLTEAQQASIREILQAGRAGGEPLQQQLRESLEALHELYEDDQTSDRALEAAVNAVIDARKALHEHRVGIKDQVQAVLTPRQQAQLVLMAERRGQGPRGQMGPRQRGRGRPTR